jgi:hypothetical protein
MLKTKWYIYLIILFIVVISTITIVGNNLYSQNPIVVGGGSGTFVTLSGDASSTTTGGATVVNGIKGVLFCTGYTPTNRQFVVYTTGGTPNPCYAAASGGSGGQLTATFLLCAGGCYVGETTNWKWFAEFPLTFTQCGIDAITYPTGSAVTVDLLKGGTTTIFSSAIPTLADGSSIFVNTTGMATNASFTQGQFITAAVTGVGSTVAGQFVTVTCMATY